MTSKLNINWLNKCRCGNRMHTVETVRGSHVRLFEDDAVKCNACGREGVIQTCDGIATVLWETDEERAEGVTMTKSTITRERAQQIFLGNGPEPSASEERELARIALAAMDNEPVAWVSSGALDSRLAGIEAVTIPFVPGMDTPLFRHPVVTHDGDFDAELFGFARRSGDLVVIDVNGDPHVRDGMPLYRHAQPAPVVPEEITIETATIIAYGLPTTNIGKIFKAGHDTCRAAMLQAGTPTNEGTRQVDELTMWIKRLVRSLKNSNPDSKLPREAMDYLTAKGLISVGDILR